MSVEFIGFISNNNSSETIVRTGPVLDRLLHRDGGKGA